MKSAWAALLAAALPLAAPAAEAPLRFRVTEGDTLNAFHRDGSAAAHLLLNSGRKPRVLVAFPAGNSGVGVWFEETASPVRWTLAETETVTRRDERGRALHGIVAEASVDAPRLVVRDAVLGSVRVLRDFQLGVAYPPSVRTAVRIYGHTATWERPRIDGAPGYAIAVEVRNGRVSGGRGAPLALAAVRAGEPMRLRITALTGERPLTPLPARALLDRSAGTDLRSRQVLEFLSYREKFLAGSWRFDTYFGRDTLMSLRLLMPALKPEAIEDGMASVLERLNPQGEVAHEEDIGEFALLRHRKEKGSASPYDDAPIYDYAMIDDDRMLAPIAAAYLLDDARGRSRAAAFLARKTASGETLGAALARNFAFVLESSAAFSRQPVAQNLIALKPGRDAGQWRDSREGLAGGRYPYDVNAVFMPAALHSIARFQESGLMRRYATSQQQSAFSEASERAEQWLKHAPERFRAELPAARAQAAIKRYARSLGVDSTQALASMSGPTLPFDALALDAKGRPIPILHSDGGFALLFLDQDAKSVETTVENMLRPFPAGLLTGAGMVVANPAYADSRTAEKFGRNAYHGTVIWSWQQALLAAGLARQLQREDLPADVRSRLRDAQRRLWDAIEGASGMRTSELWSWSYADGRYRAEPFGQNAGDADESNAAQLWSTVYLAIPRPGRAAESSR